MDGTNEYFIIVEKKVLFGGLTSFCKSLALWFSLHYIYFNLEYDKAVNEVALFMQEFVLTYPHQRLKRIPHTSLSPVMYKPSLPPSYIIINLLFCATSMHYFSIYSFMDYS